MKIRIKILLTLLCLAALSAIVYGCGSSTTATTNALATPTLVPQCSGTNTSCL